MYIDENSVYVALEVGHSGNDHYDTVTSILLAPGAAVHVTPGYRLMSWKLLTKCGTPAI